MTEGFHAFDGYSVFEEWHAERLLAYLREHFGHKIGAFLYLPYREDEFAFPGKVLKAAEKAVPRLAWKVLKKGLGL